FAGNTLLISLERLAEKGWINRTRLGTLSTEVGPIDYERVTAQKVPLLREAANNFINDSPHGAHARFSHFCAENSWWLEDYVLYDALRDRYRRQPWNAWPAELARRNADTIEAARTELASELAIRRVLQFAFYEQWRSIRHYCAQRSIRVVGDIAIFVDYDSCDVWANRDLFRLRDDLQPEVVSGVPPDAFSASGQRWGNPL